MRLIKTIALEFREGKSDKVYEVNLCEVGPDRFVVNFRYGRRGAKLQTGSKTAVPVPRDKAERIYDEVVGEKVGKGYHEPGAAPAAAAAAATAPAGTPAAAVPVNVAAQREAAILVRLRAGVERQVHDRLEAIARGLAGGRAAHPRGRAADLGLPARREEAAQDRATPAIDCGPHADLVALDVPGGSSARTDSADPREDRPHLMDLLGFHVGSIGQTDPKLPGRTDPELSPRALLPTSSAAQPGRRKGDAGLLRGLALGRCGTAESIPRLRAFAMDPASPAPARRIALESIRLLMTPKERAETARQVLDGLSPTLAGALKRGEAGEFRDRLRAAIDEAAERAVVAMLEALPSAVHRHAYWQGPMIRFIDRAAKDPQFRAALRERVDLKVEEGYGVLADLYWIDDERSRAALLAFLRSAPLGPNLVRIVRYLFKVAELRDDDEMLGLLTYRFETTRPSGQWGYNVLPFAMSENPFATSATTPRYPLVTRAFTSPTRKYLCRHAWRILLDRGELGEPEYVRMAEQILRHFSDGDALPVFTGHQRRNGWGKTGGATIDRFGPCYVFNCILYGNSPRYTTTRGGFFICKGKYQPGSPPPEQREEAFPKLWDRARRHSCAWRLASRCTPVHEFAARALRANPEFCRGLDLATVKRLAASLYEPTARLGLDQAIERFDPANPDPELVLILADSPLADAR